MISVAIDGPSGAGKSTLSRRLAEKLGFIYVDTGALYRTIGLKFWDLGYDRELNCDIESVLEDTKLDIRFIDGEQRVFLGNEDVSEKIRIPEISMMASAVSARKEVRAFLLEMQRSFAKNNNVIMDGRDIGTVVLPNATVKIFLTASIEDRAKRRYDELLLRGKKVTFKEVYDDMAERDFNDSNRAIAPLKPAEDAVIADTTGCQFDESLDKLLNIIKKKAGI